MPLNEKKTQQNTLGTAGDVSWLVEFKTIS